MADRPRARINPETGIVEGMIDLTGLLAEEDRLRDTDVLNGIAIDPKMVPSGSRVNAGPGFIKSDWKNNLHDPTLKTVNAIIHTISTRGDSEKPPSAGTTTP